MSDTLVIRLGRDSAAVQYLLVDATGGRLGAVIRGPLSQAAALASNRRVVVIVPAVDVVLAEPELPAKNAARLAQLVPFALEEQLATDIDNMHFAVGKRGANGKAPAAAVLREHMERWLAELGQAGIRADALHAETSLLPPTNGGVTLVLDQNLLYVQPINAAGFVLDTQPLADALHFALPHITALGDVPGETEEQPIPGDLQMFIAQDDFEAQQTALAEFRDTHTGLQTRLLPEGPLPLFATQIAQGTPLNLLCGPFERKSSLSASLQPWRYAAVLFGIAVCLQLIYGGLRLWQTTRAERQVDAQIRELAAQTLPGINVTDTRDVRKQFEERLGALNRSGPRGDLLTGLVALGDALVQAKDTRLEALQYHTQTIDLRVTAPNFDTLDKIQQAAVASGVDTKIQSSTQRDNKVEGRLQLKL